MCKCDGIYDDNYAFFTTYQVPTWAEGIRPESCNSCSFNREMAIFGV